MYIFKIWIYKTWERPAGGGGGGWYIFGFIFPKLIPLRFRYIVKLISEQRFDSFVQFDTYGYTNIIILNIIVFSESYPVNMTKYLLQWLSSVWRPSLVKSPQWSIFAKGAGRQAFTVESNKIQIRLSEEQNDLHHWNLIESTVILLLWRTCVLL